MKEAGDKSGRRREILAGLIKVALVGAILAVSILGMMLMGAGCGCGAEPEVQEPQPAMWGGPSLRRAQD